MRPVTIVVLVVGETALIGGLIGRNGLLAGNRITPHWAERLALGAFDLGRICAAAALQVEVFSYRVIK